MRYDSTAWQSNVAHAKPFHHLTLVRSASLASCALRTSFAVLTLSAVPQICAEEEVVQMPKFEVTADVIATMIPCAQVAEICQEAAAYKDTFDLSVLTVIKAPASTFPRKVRCFIRDKDGRVQREITNDSLLFPVDTSWREGFLSSNQPVEYSHYYLLLKPRFKSAEVTLGEASTLLRQFTDFSEKRLMNAIRHYGGGRIQPTLEMRLTTIPDEIVLFATSPEAANTIAARVGVRPVGHAVRLTREQLAMMVAEKGAGFVVGNALAEIACISPWGRLIRLPPVRDGAAMFAIGWVEYKRTPQDRTRRDFVAVGMQPALSH